MTSSQRHGAFGTDLDTLLHRGTFSGWRGAVAQSAATTERIRQTGAFGVRHPEEGDIYVIRHNCGWRSGAVPGGGQASSGARLSDTTAKALGVYESSSPVRLGVWSFHI